MSEVEKQEKNQQKKPKRPDSTGGKNEPGKEKIHAAHSDTELGRKEEKVVHKSKGGEPRASFENGNQAGSEESSLPESAEAEAFSEREEELKRENEKLMDAFLRLKADFENYRKRMIKEQTRIVETAEAGLIEKLLPILDNLERATLHADDKGSNADSALLDGIKIVYGQFLDVLEKEGLEIINPQGEPFDPEKHEAVVVVESDECPENTVVEVLEKGYKFRGFLIKPAMVKVSCLPKE